MSWKETDVLQLWKNATVVPVSPELRKAEDDIVEKNSVTRRLSGTRSKLWTSFIEMTPENRKIYLERLIVSWPYKWERRALMYPLHVANFGSLVSCGLLTAKINADIHLCNPNMRFLESLRTCTKVPVIVGIYTSGMLGFIFNQKLVFGPLVEDEERPCTSCILARTIGVSLFSGIVFPVIASPHLSYHMYLAANKAAKNAPPVRNHIDIITLSYEYSRSVWRLLPYHIIAQVAIGTVATFCLIWGRNRIYETIDVDPDLVSECVAGLAEKEKSRWIIKLKDYLSSRVPNKSMGHGPMVGLDDNKAWRS